MEMIAIYRAFYPKMKEQIFLKCTENILKDKPYVGTENKSQ